nr:response regulator [uncultured Niameybacter sp.]
MYNVLIVDDEKIIRIGMRAIIDWQAYGFKVVGIVSDGEQALQVIEEEEIDLVITDIKMPKIDGIQLVKRLKELEFNGQIIMLTSYGEFDLARECLRYGVHDYLLKGTLRSSELIQALEGVRPKLKDKAIGQEGVAIEENTQDYELMTQVGVPILKGEKVNIEAKAFSKHYQFLLIRYIESKYEESRNIDRKFSDYKVAIKNIIAEILPKSGDPFMIFEGNWCLYSLPFFGEVPYHEIHKISLQIQNLIKLYTNIKIIGVIGKTIYTSRDLESSIKQCMKATDIAFYTGYDDVLKEEAAQLIKPYKLTEEGTYEKQLYEAMRQGHYTEAVQALNEYFKHLKEYYMPQKEVELILSNILERFILDYGIYLENEKEQIEIIMDKYKKSTLLDEYQGLIDELIYIICTSIGQVRDKHYRKEIVEIMDYVEEHIGEKITLGSIANHINMNESYISRLFKQETGMNIINYINIRKMEKAKELLGEKNMIVKDVAYALGFEEQSYFNRMFNKYFGVNPKEYKRCTNSK